jgi:hypothetical protein
VPPDDPPDLKALLKEVRHQEFEVKLLLAVDSLRHTWIAGMIDPVYVCMSPSEAQKVNFRMAQIISVCFRILCLSFRALLEMRGAESHCETNFL